MPEPFRLLVTGSRHCTEDQAASIKAKIQDTVIPVGQLRKVIVIHGQCPNGGVDLVAHEFATNLPYEYRGWIAAEPHPADWDRHGRAAGPIRNAEMVSFGADLCLAFPAPGSRGTWDCIRKAADAGITVEIYPLMPDRA